MRHYASLMTALRVPVCSAGSAPGLPDHFIHSPATTMANPLKTSCSRRAWSSPTQIKKATKEKRQAQRGNAPDVVGGRRQAQQHKAESDRNRNREQMAEREHHQLRPDPPADRDPAAQRQSGGDSTFQFVDAGKIKKITLHKAQRPGDQRRSGRGQVQPGL